MYEQGLMEKYSGENFTLFNDGFSSTRHISNTCSHIPLIMNHSLCHNPVVTPLAKELEFVGIIASVSIRELGSETWVIIELVSPPSTLVPRRHEYNKPR